MLPLGGWGWGRVSLPGILLGFLAAALHAQTPTIVSLAAGQLTSNAASLPAAITTGTNIEGFRLFISGSFTPGLFQSVTWTDPRSGQAAVFYAGNDVQVTPTQIVVIVPAVLFRTQVTNAIAVSVTVNEFLPESDNTNASNAATFTLNPPLGPPVNGQSLPGGVVGVAYANPFFRGGTAPYTVALESGALPGGLALPGGATSSQSISGTPTTAGLFAFGPRITDAWNNSINLNETVAVLATPAIVGPLVPGSAPAGSAGVQLIVNGTNFMQGINSLSANIPGSTVEWTAGGTTTGLTTTFISSTQLGATVPAALLTTPLTATVTVIQPGTALVSNGAPFVVTAPAIASISPASRTAGAAPFTLTVTGTNFVTGANGSSQIRFGQALVATTATGAGTLTATVNTPGAAGAVNVQVVNPGGAASNAAVFTVVAAPTLLSLAPASTTAGSGAFNLSVSGTNFTSGMTVLWNGQALATSFVSPSQLTAAVPANLVATDGRASVSVTTADGVSSGGLAFTINGAPIPPLTFTTPSPLTPPATVGVYYSNLIAAEGGQGGYTFSVTSGATPDGVTVYPDGRINGVPGAFGTYTFTMQVADGKGATATKTYVLVVQPTPLAITTAPALSGVVGTPLSITFGATGGTGKYTFSSNGSLPPGAQFTAGGTLTATLTAPGVYQFSVIVSDTGGSTTSKNFTLTVTGQALTITTASPLPGGVAGAAYAAVQLGATGGQQPYAWSATGVPAGLGVSSSGQLAGTPTTAGIYTVAATVTDAAGGKASASLSLTIRMAIATTALPAGAVGVVYSASLSAAGGVGALTWTVAGLPDGLSGASNGSITGTPKAAGSSTVNVSVTDSQGNSASAGLSLTIGPAPPPALRITTTSVPAGTVGTAYSASFAASGGTQPYTWSATGGPADLSFSANGTLSGTPKAPGTSSLTVTVKDSTGASASQSFSLTIGLPTVATLTFTGIGTSANPGSQSTVTVGLGSAFPVDVTVVLTLTFTPDTGGDDPAVQFSTGGRTATIVIPAGATSGATNVGLQTGTVSGTITITAQLTAASQNVTPAPTPSRTIRISPTAPVIVPPVTATRTSTGFTVTVVGYSSTRQLNQATFQFTAAAGVNLQTGTVTIPLDSLFGGWYQSTASAQYGSQFTYTQPFTVTGGAQSIASVTVTLTNSVGTSQAVSANLQ